VITASGSGWAMCSSLDQNDHQLSGSSNVSDLTQLFQSVMS